VRYIRIGLALLVCSLPNLAQHSTRDFMAKWSYAAPQHHENQVNLRLTLRIWNQGQTDLRDGTIELRERRDDTKRIAVASSVEIEKGRSKTLHAFVDISESEFQLWLGGSKPNIELTFRDSDGNVRTWPVDVSPAMGDENDK